MHHLGDVLMILSDLSPDHRCRALDEALRFYNEHNPDARVEPVGVCYTELVNFFPFSDGFDPAKMPRAPETTETAA